MEIRVSSIYCLKSRPTACWPISDGFLLGTNDEISFGHSYCLLQKSGLAVRCTEVELGGEVIAARGRTKALRRLQNGQAGVLVSHEDGETFPIPLEYTDSLMISEDEKTCYGFGFFPITGEPRLKGLLEVYAYSRGSCKLLAYLPIRGEQFAYKMLETGDLFLCEALRVPGQAETSYSCLIASSSFKNRHLLELKPQIEGQPLLRGLQLKSATSKVQVGAWHNPDDSGCSHPALRIKGASADSLPQEMVFGEVACGELTHVEQSSQFGWIAVGSAGYAKSAEVLERSLLIVLGTRPLWGDELMTALENSSRSSLCPVPEDLALGPAIGISSQIEIVCEGLYQGSPCVAVIKVVL